VRWHHFEYYQNDVYKVTHLCHFDKNRNKDSNIQANVAIEALGALSQEHRLAIFRLLVRAGERGMAAGAIADALGVPNSSLSFHLAQLNRAGLIRQERQHRSLIYRANYAAMNALVGYLMENCCAGAECGTDAACEPPPLERKSA
jgi:ArsR family transcriptional regulator, arsenate/arsenite/antimonite-responsive transcriptional repressor